MRWAWWLTLVVVAAWSVANCLLVYRHLLLSKPPLAWDEAAHALQGLIIASDLGVGDLPALLYDSYRQVYHPPVFSWLAGAFFLVYGTTTETARLSSLVWTAPMPVVLFLAGRRLSPVWPWLAGGLAAALALTSPAVANYGSDAMLEAPGILALSVGVWLYLRLVDQPTAARAALLGLTMILTYLTKSNYGVLLVLAVLVERLWHTRLDPLLALWKAPWRYAVLVLGAGLLLWFAYPPKLRNSWAALVNSPLGPEPYSLDGVLYYPRALAPMIGPTWLLAFLLIAVAASLTRLSRPKVRFLVIVLAIQMGFATWSATKVERHIITMLPPLFLLGGYWLAEVAHKLGGQGRLSARALAILMPLLFVGGSFQSFYSDLLDRPPGPADDQAFALVRYLADLSRSSGPLLVASTVDAGPPQIDWYLATEGRMSVFSAGYLTEHYESQGRALQVTAPMLRNTLDRLSDRNRSSATTRSLYAGLPLEGPDFVTEEDFAAGVVEAARRYRLPKVAVVKTSGASRLYQTGLLEKRLLGSGYRRVDSREFRVASATVDLYMGS